MLLNSSTGFTLKDLLFILSISLSFFLFPSLSLSECIEGDCENGKGAYILSTGEKYEGERTIFELKSVLTEESWELSKEQIDEMPEIKKNQPDASDRQNVIIVPPNMDRGKGKSSLSKWSCGCTNIRVGVRDLEALCLKCGDLFRVKD